MNASSWKKAVDLVPKVTQANPQVQAAAMAESQHLQSLPLSALSLDDSGPPQVTYDYQQPIATSTPRATSAETPKIPTEAYHQILPGMSDCLYPTLVADGSLATHAPDNHGTLQTQLTSEVDKYLQEVAERCEKDVNYFDGWHMATNTTTQQQEVESVKNEEEKILELIDHDIGANDEINIEHYIQYHDELATILEENEEEPPMTAQDDVNEADTIPYTPEESDDKQFNMAINDTSKDPMIVLIVFQMILIEFQVRLIMIMIEMTKIMMKWPMTKTMMKCPMTKTMMKNPMTKIMMICPMTMIIIKCPLNMPMIMRWL